MEKENIVTVCSSEKAHLCKKKCTLHDSRICKKAAFDYFLSYLFV